MKILIKKNNITMDDSIDIYNFKSIKKTIFFKKKKLYLYSFTFNGNIFI